MLADSLAAALRSAGAQVPSFNSVPLDAPFDIVCDSLAKSSRITLVVIDIVRGRTFVYNTTTTGIPTIYVERTDEWFRVLPRKPSHAGQYVYYETPVTETLDHELPSAAPAPRGDPIAEDFDASGWVYDVDPTDCRTIRPEAPNVVLCVSSQPMVVNELDLVIKLPGHYSASYAVGYSATAKVVFRSVVVHPREMADSVSLIKIPNGMGVCLLNQVSDVIVSDQDFRPVCSFNVFAEVFAFVRGVYDSGVTGVIGKPLVTTAEEAIDDDIASRCTDLRVSGEIQDGECLYSYRAAHRGDIPQTAKLKTLMTSSGVFTDVLHTPSSCLCFTLEAVDGILAVMGRYVPTKRSILYTVNEAFVTFLCAIGYPHELPNYETLKDAYGVYMNVRIINARLTSGDGTLVVDMRPFQSITNTAANTVTLNGWKEQHTAIMYMVK